MFVTAQEEEIYQFCEVDQEALELEEVADAREREVEEEVTPSRMDSSRGQRRPPIFASRGRQSPF